MKEGRSLQALAQEVDRLEKAKRDFVTSTHAMSMELSQADVPQAYLHLDGLAESDESNYVVTPHCHGQFANRLGIPKNYYDLMLANAPELLTQNVNHWLHKKPQSRMVRTLDGNARAFLSDRYRPLDHYDLLKAAMPTLKEHKDIQIISCEVTDTRFYLKAVFPKLEMEVKVGDAVQAGLVISNSEIGAGSVRVEPLIYRLVCLNGMITQSAMRKHHVGGSKGNGYDDIIELLTDETKQKSDEAFWLQVRDVIRGSLQETVFQANVALLKEATTKKIEGDPIKAIEVVTKKFRFNDKEGSDILKHLIEGGDLSQYGVAQAVTRTSQDVEDYDRATELERAGGQIIELPKSDWSFISQAA